jgi:hypothetical protein
MRETQRRAEMNQTLREYKTEKYFEINEALRNGDVTPEAEEIDEMMVELSGDQVLFRGTDFYSMELDEDEDYTGEIITDLAFVSTTKKRELAAGKYAARGLLLEIQAPAGTRGIEMDEILFENEAEVLLDRGLEFEVVEDNCNLDNRTMKVRVI